MLRAPRAGNVVGDVKLDAPVHILDGGEACLAHHALQYHAPRDAYDLWRRFQRFVGMARHIAGADPTDKSSRRKSFGKALPCFAQQHPTWRGVPRRAFSLRVDADRVIRPDFPLKSSFVTVRLSLYALFQAGFDEIIQLRRPVRPVCCRLSTLVRKSLMRDWSST